MAKKIVAATKNDFIKAIKENMAKEINLTNDQVKALYETFVQIVKDTVNAENKLVLSGFGTFKKRNLKARKGVNPKTGQKIQIKASKTVSFKAAGAFKKAL
ncbi:MAG TPA: HU family DNA-binding protein [bacterium]|nr:HU family DNA-binding protein [bacterium]HSA33153.1 HU family DNA-binding protein [bacterium]